MIIKNGCRLIIPFIQLFALYVVAHGHHSPGGGFQGGVIFGAAIILYALAYDLRTARNHLSVKTSALLSSTGVLIYAGTGALCILLGANFLDYGALAGLLGVDPVDGTLTRHPDCRNRCGAGGAGGHGELVLRYFFSRQT